MHLLQRKWRKEQLLYAALKPWPAWKRTPMRLPPVYHEANEKLRGKSEWART